MNKENKVNRCRAMLSLLVVVLAGCGGQGFPEPVASHMPIRLVTKLAVSDGGGTRGAISQFGSETIAFAAGSVSGTYSELWEARENAGEAVLLQTRYYPEDGSRLYLRGYYPPEKPGNNGVAYRLDGSQDILVSNEQSGCLTDMFWQESKLFTFSHLLTQLLVRVRLSGGYPAGTGLSHLQIDGSHPDMLLDLNKGQLLAVGETKPLAVIPDVPVMVEPGVALTLDAVVNLPDGTQRIYKAMPIRFQETDGLSRAGTSYTLIVTLDMEEENLSISATVSGWTEKEGGETEI